eukprot:2954051-Pyramimonas_sp.AAC.1
MALPATSPSTWKSYSFGAACQQTRMVQPASHCNDMEGICMMHHVPCQNNMVEDTWIGAPSTRAAPRSPPAGRLWPARALDCCSCRTCCSRARTPTWLD